MKPGLHIVLEGPDASGKKTQSTLLVEHLNATGIAAERISFPQYESPYGKLITQYLEGRSPSIDPVYASILYASDRALIAPKIREKLSQGTWIICDRYVESSLAHQVAHLEETDILTDDTLSNWIIETEYEVLGIPRANHSILLNVPFELCVRKAAERKVAEGRAGVVDIHEDDKRHLEKAWQLYQKMAAQNAWPVVNCAPEGELLPREQIAAQIFDLVQEFNKKVADN